MVVVGGGGGGGVGEWVQNPDSPRGARLRRLIFNPSVCTPLRNGPATPPGWGVGGGGGGSLIRKGRGCSSSRLEV